MPSREGLRVFRQVIRKEFQSDEAAEFGILSFVHHAHPAATKLFDDAVVGNDLAQECVGLRHSVP